MMKDQKGITLVALIITIIVMLILVAVTITVALNGGLFDTARRASKETKAAQVKEAITLAKAEALASYYENMNTSGGQKTAAQFKALVEGYLDGITVTISYVDENTFSLTDTSDDEIDAYFTEHATERTISFGEVAVATN